MITHTLILSTSRFEIPSNPNVIELVNNLVDNKVVHVDYFGGQLDHQHDYMDSEMTERINNTAFITLHFDKEVDVDYEIDQESTIKLFVNLLMEQEIQEIIVNEKDIDIYIY